MSKFLNAKKYKNTQEIIMEQFWDITTDHLFVVTKSDGKWTLYNHTENKKITTSKDYINVREKIPNYS